MADRWIRASIELLSLGMIALAPWAFGARHPVSLFALSIGTSAVLILWAVRLVLTQRVTWSLCPFVLSLGLLFLLGMAQSIPLPEAVVARVSPASERIYQEFLPGEDVKCEADLPNESGRTISVYPDETRALSFRILGLLAVVAAVINNVPPLQGLRRLGWVAAVNGVLLSVFGIAEHFSSPDQTVYWAYPVEGTPFGPFINRNHFAFHLNLCIGATLGLLLAEWGRSRNTLYTTTGSLADRPQVAWLGGALVVMLGTLVFTLSRGAVVAAGVGLAATVAVAARRGKSANLLIVVASVTIAATAAVAWLGFDSVAQRLGTLGDSKISQNMRFTIWARTVDLAGDFPVLGTGYGTFGYVEPLTVREGETSILFWDHAHNEWLEALVEGGVIRLVLTVFMFASAVYFAARLARRGDGEASPLAAGALFAVVASAVHSVIEFAIHMPANALLLGVMAAHVSRPGRGEEPSLTVRSRAVAVAVGLGCVLVAVCLVREGWKRHAAEQHRLVSFYTEGRQATNHLESACAISPNDVKLRNEYGEKLLAEYFSRRALKKDPAEDTERFLQAALIQFRRARACCPLLSNPHIRLAQFADSTSGGDQPDQLLSRARTVRKADPETWFRTGAFLWLRGDKQQAMNDWRRHLALSPDRLEELLKIVGPDTPDQALIDCLLPEVPLTVIRAARVRHPDDEASQGTYYRAAEQILSRRLAESGPADQYRLHGAVLSHLGRHREAARRYEQAIRLLPENPLWRFEYARELMATGKLAEAKRELLLARFRDKNLPGLEETYRSVLKRLAEQKRE